MATEAMNPMLNQNLTLAATLDAPMAEDGDSDDSPVEMTATFLSGEVVEMGWGLRLRFALDGGDYERVQSERAPVLMAHDYEQVLGVVSAVDGGRATLRFRDTPEAQMIVRDIRNGTYPKGVSAGLRPTKIKTIRNDDGDYERTEILEWRLNEISVAPVPALNVGFTEAQASALTADMKAEAKMSTQTETQAQASAPAIPDSILAAREIVELGELAGSSELAQTAVREGKTPVEFRAMLASQTLADKPFTRSVEAQDRDGGFNMNNLMIAASLPENAAAQELAKAELETIKQWQLSDGGKHAPRQGGKVVPLELAFGDFRMRGASDIELALARIGGGNDYASQVQDNVQPDWLRPFVQRTPILGRTRMLTGLMGNVSYPKINAGAGDTVAGNPAYETDAAAIATASPAGDTQNENPVRSDFTPTPTEVQISPKQAYSRYSLTTLMDFQTQGRASSAIRMHIMETLARGMEYGVLYGTGANVPSGAIRQTGTNAFVVGSGGSGKGSSPDSPVDNLKILNLRDYGRMVGELIKDNVPVDESWAFVVNTDNFIDGLTNFIDEGSGKTLLTGLRTPEGGYESTLAQYMLPVCHFASLPNGAAVDAATDIIAFAGRWMDCLVGIWDSMEIVTNAITVPGITTTTILMWYDTALLRDESFVRGTYDA